MIISKEITININPSNFIRFKSLGYLFNKVGETIQIKVGDLSSGSHQKIKVKCECCNKIKEIDYCNYLAQMKKGNNKYYCFDCKNEKTKKTIINLYGVDNLSKSEVIKQRKIGTTLKNYGVEHTFQSKINKDKRTKSMFEKYGVYHNSQLDSYKLMRMKDALEYNVEFRKYRNHIRRVTKSNKKELFDSWNGFDYYDSEYIKENFLFGCYDKLYPTIDHKISIFDGYINNISPEIIGHIDNLCVTKRSINSSKNKKTEKNFIYEKI